MAKKKRRHPHQQRTSADTSGPPPRGGANQARRDRKEEARGLREAERKRMARRNSMRRLLTFAIVGLIGVAVITFLLRVATPTPLPEGAAAAAREAGCGELELLPAADAPGGQHMSDEETQTFIYPDPPATSGQHATTTLPATTRVYDSPQAETQAVHTLEHGSVIVYYRPSGEEGGVSQEVVTRLGTLVTDAKASYLMPYPDLPANTGIAFTAWNKRVLCPGAMTPDQAATVAQGFVDAYACTSNAPEGNNGDGC